jgi:hypothetical protein
MDAGREVGSQVQVRPPFRVAGLDDLVPRLQNACRVDDSDVEDPITGIDGRDLGRGDAELDRVALVDLHRHRGRIHLQPGAGITAPSTTATAGGERAGRQQCKLLHVGSPWARDVNVNGQ